MGQKGKKRLLIAGCCLLCLAVLTGAGVWYHRNHRLYDDTLPPLGINLYSLAELETMREMALCEDEEALEDYLWGVPGGGAHSRENMEAFLALWDALPYLPILDGRVIWINADYPYGAEGDFSTAAVAVKAENGDWFRLHYLFSLSAQEGKYGAPIAQSSDRQVKVYREYREKHPTDAGDLIRWSVVADEYCVLVEYYAEHPECVSAEEVFANLSVQHLADLS